MPGTNYVSGNWKIKNGKRMFFSKQTMRLFLHNSYNYSAINNCDFILILIKILWPILMRPRTTWGLAMFHGNLVCHFFFFKFLSGWADKLWEKEEGKSRSWLWFSIFSGHVKSTEVGTSVFCRGRKNELVFIWTYVIDHCAWHIPIRYPTRALRGRFYRPQFDSGETKTQSNVATWP